MRRNGTMHPVRVPEPRPVEAPVPERTQAEYAAIAQMRWWELGYTDARVWTEYENGREVIKSNLKNGVPPSLRGEEEGEH